MSSLNSLNKSADKDTTEPYRYLLSLKLLPHYI